jgi:hypothetical protein
VVFVSEDSVFILNGNDEERVKELVKRLKKLGLIFETNVILCG